MDKLPENFRGYYPGSKTPLPVDEKPKPAPKDGNAWDSNPVVKRVSGADVELFTIGAVCKALGRPPVTIRLWVRQRHIPDATFRLPGKTSPSGRRIEGRRLYTRKQIEGLIQVFKTHGIYEAERVDWSKHPTFLEDVKKAWETVSL